MDETAAAGEARARANADAVQLAAQVLEEVWSGTPADRALKQALRRHRQLSAVQRQQLAARVFRVSLHRARLSHVAGGDLPEAPASQARRLLAIHLHVDEGQPLPVACAALAPPQAGAGCSVASADEHAARQPDAAAQQIARARAAPPPWPKPPAARLAAQRSVPRFVAEALIARWGPLEADELLAVMNEAGPITLRCHADPASAEEAREGLRRDLAAEGIESAPTRLSPWGLTVRPRSDGGRANLWGSRAFRAGRFEVQDEGSQLIALASAARPEEVVVDYCAGRGGKTLALAAMMRRRGRLVATDVAAHALRDLDVRLRRSGETWVEAHLLGPTDAEGGAPPPLLALRGHADLVLVDAPCSAVGTWRRGPDRRWALSPSKLSAWPLLQRQILRRAAAWVRPGGRLLYATCSVLREENEDVADAFEREFPHFAPTPLPLPAAAGDHRLHLLPHRHGTDGFFLAHYVHGPAPRASSTG